LLIPFLEGSGDSKSSNQLYCLATVTNFNGLPQLVKSDLLLLKIVKFAICHLEKLVSAHLVIVPENEKVIWRAQLLSGLFGGEILLIVLLKIMSEKHFQFVA